MVTELWKPVKGFESSYLVSSLGAVMAIGRYVKRRWETPIWYPDRILSNRIDKDGYLKISMYGDGKVKHTTLHRLVAETFIENPDNKPQVNHIDGNKLNNSVDNLEWCTVHENIIHAERAGLRKRNRNGLGQYA